MISHARVLSDVTVATYAAHPYLSSCTSHIPHRLRHPHTYIFILHVHTVSAARGTHRVFTTSNWLSFTGLAVLSMFSCFLPLLLCVSDLFLQSQENKEMKVGEGVHSWVCKHVGNEFTWLLESIVQCYWLCLHLSLVPIDLDVFNQKRVHWFTICVV